MKKIRALLMTIVLLASFLMSGYIRTDAAAFAAKAVSAKEETKTEDEAEDAGTEDTEQEEEVKTLWQKPIEVEINEIPQEAYWGDNKLCQTLSGDGRRLMFCGGEKPYLWDRETGDVTFLHPGDQGTTDTLRIMVSISPAAKDEDVEKMSDEELLSAYINHYGWAGGKGMNFQLYAPITVNGPYVRLTDRFGMFWLLNTDDGALYCRREVIASSAYDGTMLYYSMMPRSEVTTVDLETGEETVTDFSLLTDYERGAAMITASFLPDGCICAVLRDLVSDPRKGADVCLAVLPPEGEPEIYPLGAMGMSMEPNVVLSTDGNRIVLHNYNAALRMHPYLIDRTSKEVSFLSVKDDRIVSTPIEESMDPETHIAKQPAEDSVYFVCPCADGKTMIAYSQDTFLMLVEMETLDSYYLLGNTEAASLPIPRYFSGNRYDRFLIGFGPGGAVLVDVIVEDDNSVKTKK